MHLKLSASFILFCCQVSLSQVHPGIEDFIQQNDQFSGVVLMIKNDNTVHSKAYGLSNQEFNIANSLETKYCIGSISKSFTAVAILKLQELGKLNLDDDIANYLPALPSNWKGITIHHLLSNSSGLPHTMSNTAFWETSSYGKDSQRVLEHFTSDTLAFEPGENYRYSGLGFYLLSMIVEKASNTSYQEFMKAAIFDKANLRDTYALTQEIPLPNLAAGYIEENGQLVKSRRIHPSNAIGGGNIVTNVLDMAKWGRALFTGKIISEESLKKMLTVVQNNYGYGFFVVKNENYMSVSHGGAVPGISSYFAQYPHNGSMLIVFSNFPNSKSLKFRDVVKRLKDITLDES